MRLRSTSSVPAGLPAEGTLAEVVAAARKRFGKRYYKTVKRTYGGSPQVEVLTVAKGYHGRYEKRQACYAVVD